MSWDSGKQNWHVWRVCVTKVQFLDPSKEDRFPGSLRGQSGTLLCRDRPLQKG